MHQGPAAGVPAEGRFSRPREPRHGDPVRQRGHIQAAARTRCGSPKPPAQRAGDSLKKGVSRALVERHTEQLARAGPKLPANVADNSEGHHPRFARKHCG